MNLRKIFTLIFFAAISVLCAKAQQSAYNKAVDLFNKGVYAEAQQQFMTARSATSSTDKTRLENIDYYNAVCALKLKQSNAELLVQNFINKNKEGKQRNILLFEMGLYAHDTQKNYRAAANYFEQVKRGDLSMAEQGEYCFKYGYSLMKIKKNDDALHLFAEAKENTHTRYASQAEYYYAHILYEQKKYAAALDSFEKLKRDKDFADVVPYYILQIYFYQGNYDRVISDGEAFYPKASKARQGEVARVLADAYLRKGNNAKSLEYFKIYENAERTKKTPEDSYLMAYAYYENGDFTKAQQTLEHISIKNDTLSQKTLYLLGGTYAENGNKQKAMTTFQRASKMNFDKEITRDSRLNYAKLALELNNDTKPMSEFVNENKDQINDPVIRDNLIKTYIAEKKFDEAVKLVEQTPNPTDNDYKNIQKATYYSGLEQFKTKNFDGAIKLFDTSLKYGQYDRDIAALAKYWKSESLYSQNNFDAARQNFNDFLQTAPRTSNEYKMAHYTLGYCDFRQDNYESAAKWFNKYLTLNASAKNPYIADCYNRLGDCNFKKRNFAEASRNYEKSYTMALANPDYALYQNAITMGFLGKDANKRTMLNKVVSQYPNSTYAPAATYESGRMYTQQQNYTSAEKDFKAIVSKYPQSTYYRKALVELGLINVNKNNGNAAMAYYKKVVDEYPNSDEAKDALDGIKDIYVENGNVDDYFAYAKGKNISTEIGDRDSLTFAAAERIYLAGNCDKSITAMKNYIAEYPNGQNAASANYYIGDCYYKSQKYNEAATYLQNVINKPDSEFSDNALREYAYAQYQTGDFINAASGYEQISQKTTDKNDIATAQMMAMRSYYKSENYQKAISLATQAATSATSSDDKNEALLTKARSLQELDRDDEAYPVFKTLSANPQTAEGAEATYNVIDYLYSNGKQAEAEKAVYKFSDSKTPQAEWLARSFIVLANIYIDKKEYYQAKATLNSVIENYKRNDDGVLEEAKNTLEEIKDKQ